MELQTLGDHFTPILNLTKEAPPAFLNNDTTDVSVFYQKQLPSPDTLWLMNRENQLKCVHGEINNVRDMVFFVLNSKYSMGTTNEINEEETSAFGYH